MNGWRKPKTEIDISDREASKTIKWKCFRCNIAVNAFIIQNISYFISLSIYTYIYIYYMYVYTLNIYWMWMWRNIHQRCQLHYNTNKFFLHSLHRVPFFPLYGYTFVVWFFLFGLGSNRRKERMNNVCECIFCTQEGPQSFIVIFIIR